MRCVVSGLALALTPALAWAQAAPVEPFLDLGVKQVADGDFEAAVFSLDTAIRRLAGDSKREAQLARAYVHLGVAYVGLDHEPGARGKFREALRLAPKAQPPADLASPKVMKLFEEERLKLAAKKSAKKRNIAIGVAGAVAATVTAMAASEAASNKGPASVSIGVLPGGFLIPGVTVAHFWANAVDPEGSALTFAWDFGDGVTAQGVETSHLFQTPGTYRVTVTATDNQGATGTATLSAGVGSLSGTWGEMGCTQDGPSMTCQRASGDPPDQGCTFRSAWFTLADPRQVSAGAVTTLCESGWQGANTCEFGEVGPNADWIVCIGAGGPDMLLRQ